MPKRRAIPLLFLLGLLIFPAASWSQEILSPPAKAACKFSDGKTISVNYSSPRMRGRKIYGDLVPYGVIWRVGANEATTFVTTADLIVGGKLVSAGEYTLFTVPNPDKWTLVISKETGEWGIPYPGTSHDLLRADIKVGKLAGRVENFAIAFDQAGSTCTMHLDWETTRASIDISEKKAALSLARPVKFYKVDHVASRHPQSMKMRSGSVYDPARPALDEGRFPLEHKAHYQVWPGQGLCRWELQTTARRFIPRCRHFRETQFLAAGDVEPG